MSAPADCPICCPGGWSPNVDQTPDEHCPEHGRKECAPGFHSLDYVAGPGYWTSCVVCGRQWASRGEV